ncbi:MAG: hypothetical protein WC565_00775 [Parcubacteria group bacterium]
MAETIPTQEKTEKTKKAARRNEEISETDYSPIKVFAVIAVTAAFAFLFGYALFAWSFFSAIVTGIVFASFITLVPVLVKARKFLFLVSLFSSVLLALPLFIFGRIPFIPIIILAAVSVIILTEGIWRGKRELDNSLRVSFTKFSGKVLARAFTIIALAIAVSYGWNFKAEDLFSERFVRGMISVSSPVIGYYAPGFTLNMSFRDFLTISARQSLARPDAVEFALMPEGQKERLIDQKIADYETMLRDDIGLNIDLDASFEENFRNAATDKFQDVIETIPSNYLALIATIIIFTAVRGAFWLLGWLVALLSFLIYQLILAIKFAEVYFEPKSKEVVLLR